MNKYEKFIVDRNFLTSVLISQSGMDVNTTSMFSTGTNEGGTYVSTELVPYSGTDDSSSNTTVVPVLTKSSTYVSTKKSRNLNSESLNSKQIGIRLDIIKKVARRIKSLATCNPFIETLTTIHNKGNDRIIDKEKKKIIVNYLAIKKPLIDTISIVENSLYENSNSFAEYSDMNTIDLRIRNLLLEFVGMSDEVYMDYCYKYKYRYNDKKLDQENSLNTFSADLFCEYSKNVKKKKEGNTDGNKNEINNDDENVCDYIYWNNDLNSADDKNEKIEDIGHENKEIMNSIETDSTYVSTWQDLMENQISSVKDKIETDDVKYKFRINISNQIPAILRDIRSDLKYLNEDMIKSLFHDHIQHLETCLYQEALSFHEYNDLNTLKRRLLDLMTRISEDYDINFHIPEVRHTNLKK
jgi:hypothetical protein